MLKKIFFILLGSILLLGNTIQLDVNSLQKAIKKNKHDVNNRLLLAKYYKENKEYQKALDLISEILKISPKNKIALALKTETEKALINQKLTKKYGNLDNYIDKLYKEAKYKQLISFYEKFKPALKQESLIKISRVAMWEGKYDLSLNILNKIKEKNIDIIEIKAYDYLYKGNMLKANQMFKILYNVTGNKEYGEKLIETYLALGDTMSAKKVLYSLKYKLSKKEYQKYLNAINKQIYSYINYIKKTYEKNPTFDNLKKLVFSLQELKPKEAIAYVEDYVKKHPDDMNANIFLAKLYTWNGQTDKASKILDRYINSDNYQAKLLYGKILAWNGMYKKASIFLSDVYENGNKTQKFEALKMLGFIQMWQNKRKNAKKIFNRLYKINPKDEEVKEALMILNGNIKPLINKYEKLLKKTPNNSEYILKLADLYYIVPNYNQSAKYYELYLKKNPDKIELYKTLGDIYLELKEYYKGFSDWEYYTAIKNSPEAYLELAKRYYWNGFNKEALDVLNKILNKYSNYKPAIELKAKILKVNPRFIYSANQTAIEKYFTNRSQKLLIYGDRSFFAGYNKTASEYYKEYLMINPTDNKIREKYAYTLEFTANYKAAAGEFYNLLWEKKNPLLEYHYAYCLQKSGNTKKAKKIYQELLKNVPKPLNKKMKTFLNEWKKAWESMNFKRYSSFYDKKIRNNLYWRLKKQNIFKNASFISVGIYDPILLNKTNNIYKIRFYQVYASKNKKDKGYKTLWVKCYNAEECYIIKENWKAGEYNPNNPEKSLILRIKKNLNDINNSVNIFQNQKIPQNSQNKPYTVKKKFSNFIPLQGALNNKSKITLAVKTVKRETNESIIKKNLNLETFKVVKITKKNSITKSINKKSRYHFLITYYHFHDNQQTKYNQLQGLFTKNFGLYDIGIFGRVYHLNVADDKDTGNLIAGVFNYSKYKFMAGIDNADKSNLFLNFNTNYLNHNIDILYENLVYSRRTICSLKHKRLKIEASRYSQINNIRGLWYSIAGEYIDDGNIVFTPQIDYDFYSNRFFDNPYSLFFSGWYQFNTKQTPCYYSPDKTDSNLIGIKFYPKNKYLHLMLKGGIGYSFWDQAFLYNLAFNANKTFKLFNLNAGCTYSNTSGTNSPNSYKSYECSFDMEKRW